MTRLRLGCTLLLIVSSLGCHLPSASDLQICKHATLSAHLSGPAVLSNSADLKQFTLDFGVISGTQEQAVWTLDNPGQLEVTVLKVVDTLDPAWNVDIQQGQTIPAHGHLDLKVTFMPPTTGTFTHSLSIVTDACLLSSVGLTLKGAQVATPALLTSDTLIDFGPDPVASRSQRTVIVTLSNISDVDLTVQTSSVSGAQANAFEAFGVGGRKSVTVAAGKTADLNIQFSPGTNTTGMNEHYEAYLTISYCLDGCTTYLKLQGDSYECLTVQPPAVVFDGGAGYGGVSLNFNTTSMGKGNYLCNHPIAVGIQTQFLNQLPDGGPADGGPFSLDPWVVDGGLSVYWNSAGLGVTFAPTDDVEYRGTLTISYADPMPEVITIPMMGYASCLIVPQGTQFSAFAGGAKDAETLQLPITNDCSKTGVQLTAAPVLWNILPDGGKTTEGPFQLGPGSPEGGVVLAPNTTLEVPVVYAPTQMTYDTAEIDLATDEAIGGLTSISFYGYGYGPSYQFQNYLDFTSSWGTTTTRSTLVYNYSNDYPNHTPAILGVGTNCPGMSASVDAGLPAPLPYGQWYELDATWTVPSCDGGECGCDGGWCNCSIYLQTSDFPPPQQTLTVYY